MNELNFTYYGPYNSNEPMVLNYIKRYTNENRFNQARSDEEDIPEGTDYHLIFSSTSNTKIKTCDFEYDIPENSFIIYKPQGKQLYTQPPSSSFVICIFSGTHVKPTLASLELKCNTIYTLSRKYMSADDFLYFNKQIETIANEYNSKDYFYKQKINALFFSFLVSCARSIKLNDSTNTATQMQQIIRYINENIGKPLDIDLLVEMSYLSRSRFYHVFKEYTGTSPIGYQNKYRMNLAKDYLSFHPEYSISSIASALGFNDQLYFSKLFKKEYGVSPSQYRKNSTKS